MQARIIIVVFIALFLPWMLYATEYSSANFNVKDPILSSGGGDESTSASFKLVGAIGQISLGTSSATTFGVNPGFLYFPEVTTPVVSATAGDGEVSLSWTASVGVLGWTVGGYNVGQSTTAGGPYSFTSVGNVTSSTRTGLTNTTAYYFVVRPEDAFGNTIATSTEVSATPVRVSTGDGVLITLLKQFVQPPFYRRPVPPPPVSCFTDLNCDGKINLQDLSIFLYLEPKPIPNLADLNKDAKVNTQDLSILFSAWTEQQLTFIPEGAFALREEPSVERRLELPQPAAIFKAFTPEEEVKAEEPKAGIFEKAREWVGNLFEKVTDFFKAIFRE